MASDREHLEAFWRGQYSDGNVATWVMYSSDVTRGQRLKSQTYALILEAIGRVDGMRLLDAGCGVGDLTLSLAALGARAVGIDILEEGIHKLQAEQPHVQWVLGNFLDKPVLDSVGMFDRIIAVESFQCAGPPATCLRALWSCLAPGGRLVASMPNANCPIVQRTLASASHAGSYFAITPDEMKAEILALPGIDRYAMRGMTFGQDQWLAPYDVSPWALDGSAWPTANRMMIVCTRSA